MGTQTQQYGYRLSLFPANSLVESCALRRSCSGVWINSVVLDENPDDLHSTETGCNVDGRPPSFRQNGLGLLWIILQQLQNFYDIVYVNPGEDWRSLMSWEGKKVSICVG